MSTTADYIVKTIKVHNFPFFLQDTPLGDSTKAKLKLGWQPKYDFEVNIYASIIVTAEVQFIIYRVFRTVGF